MVVVFLNLNEVHMRAIRRFVEFIIVLIALGAAIYLQRVPILDWYQNITKPSVPEAVEYVDVIEKIQKENNKQDEVVNEVILEQETINKDIVEDKFIEEVTNTEQIFHDEEVEGVGFETEEVLLEEYVLKKEEFILPASINLAVPFTSQAPHANWDYPYKEACEEASVYMVHGFYNGIKPGKIDADVADKEILKIIDFENGLFGSYEDTTAEQTGVLAELMYGYSKVETIENPTIDQLRTHLAHGRPVIVPSAGRLLGNPNFQQPGPLYHMIVLRGYTDSVMFITNDPGTRNGEEFLYSFDTIMQSMHDFNGNNDIKEGKRVVLIIYPN